jgi:hypothetical protein
LPDPIMFLDEIRVTIQQIGQAQTFKRREEKHFEAYKAGHLVAGNGWMETRDLIGAALVERVDDYCATAFVYCQRPQAAAQYDSGSAVRDIGLTNDERKLTHPGR